MEVTCAARRHDIPRCTLSPSREHPTDLTRFLQYIALERLESIYKSCNLVANICVHANSNAKQPMAVIIPHADHLRHALEGKAGLDAHAPLAELCKDRAVAELVLKECNAVGKKNGFKPLELLQTVVLTAEEWTPESGLVTAAQKVQRNPATLSDILWLQAVQTRLARGPPNQRREAQYTGPLWPTCLRPKTKAVPTT